MSEQYKKWIEFTSALIRKKQRHPFAQYKKNKWKTEGRTFKAMYKEGLSPQQAANLWALNHEIRKG